MRRPPQLYVLAGHRWPGFFVLGGQRHQSGQFVPLVAVASKGAWLVWGCPDFLDLPRRGRKPRTSGLTHVLDKAIPLSVLAAELEGAGELVDVAKVGWGIAYIDRTLKGRAGLYRAAGVAVSLGGTLLEVAAGQDRVAELRRWAAEQGVDALEVSNGLGGLTLPEKARLIRELAGEFTVVAETGAKDDRAPVRPGPVRAGGWTRRRPGRPFSLAALAGCPRPGWRAAG